MQFYLWGGGAWPQRERALGLRGALQDPLGMRPFTWASLVSKAPPTMKTAGPGLQGPQQVHQHLPTFPSSAPGPGVHGGPDCLHHGGLPWRQVIARLSGLLFFSFIFFNYKRNVSSYIIMKNQQHRKYKVIKKIFPHHRC